MNNILSHKENNKEVKLTISNFLNKVKPVKNLSKELSNKNALYHDPTFIKIMKEAGYKING